MKFPQYFLFFFYFSYLFALECNLICFVYSQVIFFISPISSDCGSWVSCISSMALVLSHSLWYPDIWHRTLKWSHPERYNVRNAHLMNDERNFPCTPSISDFYFIEQFLWFFFSRCCWVVQVLQLSLQFICWQNKGFVPRKSGLWVDPETNFIRTHFN